MLPVVQIVAHRGFSGRQPEMTRAAYAEAIAWVRATGVPVSVECDVQFSADGQLVCLHDLRVDRTSTAKGRVRDLTVAQLKALDFGSRRMAEPTAAQSELLTLRELMTMVRDARREGLPVCLVIETKHPSGRGPELEEAVAALIADFGWDKPGSPVALISFSRKAVKRFGSLLPALVRIMLIDGDLGHWSSGKLPDGIRVVGVDCDLLEADPDFAARLQSRGNQLHVWTANRPDQIAFCLAAGATSITTDYPDRVAQVLEESHAVITQAVA
jgi:glycerophosphoryl diester phosphodiesterase